MSHQAAGAGHVEQHDREGVPHQVVDLAGDPASLLARGLGGQLLLRLGQRQCRSALLGQHSTEEPTDRDAHRPERPVPVPDRGLGRRHIDQRRKPHAHKPVIRIEKSLGADLQVVMGVYRRPNQRHDVLAKGRQRDPAGRALKDSSGQVFF